MSEAIVPKFKLLTLHDLRVHVHDLSQHTSEADRHEFAPVLAWAHSTSFDLLGDGPFQAPLKHPNGKNFPPDWAIYSKSKGNGVAIEISCITTERIERAAKVGRSIFDTSHLLTNKPAGRDFETKLKPNEPDNDPDDGPEAEQTYDQQFQRILKAKVQDLQRYAAKFDSCLLLLYDRLWSGAQLPKRLARIARCRNNVGTRQFDAIFVTDGSLGQVTRLATFT